MTVSEFKAWLEGFCEGMDSGYPTVGQWEKVLEKVKSLTDTPAIKPPAYRDLLPRPTWNDNRTVPFDPIQAFLTADEQGDGLRIRSPKK